MYNNKASLHVIHITSAKCLYLSYIYTCKFISQKKQTKSIDYKIDKSQCVCQSVNYKDVAMSDYDDYNTFQLITTIEGMFYSDMCIAIKQFNTNKQ